MKLVSQHGLAPFDSAFARHKLAICVKNSWMFATQRMTCWQNMKLDWLSDQFLLLHTARCSQFAYKIILTDLYIAAALLMNNACNRISQTSMPAVYEGHQTWQVSHTQKAIRSMPKSVDPVMEAVLKTYRLSKETLEGCYAKGTWQRK